MTPDGKVKVLDFGLAKAYAGGPEDINLSNSPTLSDAATQQGVILGTAAYMSPEQARGKSVDKRADVWAFGVVLFEMLIGRQVFTGETVSDTLASVLAKEPEWQSLPPNLHPRIRLMLERCLEKDPKNRYSGINDARVDIDKALTDPSGVYAKATTIVKPITGIRRILPWIAAVVLISIIIGFVIWQLREPKPQIMRFDYNLPEDQQFTVRELLSILAVSPDGKQFVYATPKGLYLRSLDELTASLIPGTEERTCTPFFSPDGKWVGYYSEDDRELKKISIDGGTPVKICDVDLLVGAHWYKDDSIVYGQLPGSIMRVSAMGGTPESVVKSTGGGFIALPQILPDGKTILYTSTTGGTDFRIRIQSLLSGDSEELFPGTSAQYLPTGHIVYNLPNDSTLYAVPFDLDKLEVRGGALPVAKNMLQLINSRHYAIADSGTLVYFQGAAMADPNNQRTLVWVNRTGKEETIGAQPMFYKYPNISPDGTKIAVTDYATGMDHHIYIWDLVREALIKLTIEGTDNISPVWSPDGKRIAFVSARRESDGGLYCKVADGTGQDEQLNPTPDQVLLPYCWSSDGKTIVGVEVEFADTWREHIAMLSIDGERTQKTLLRRASVERSPKISPDGQWMAYTSNVSGSEEVYVRPFPEVDKERWQVSTGGGAAPLWSPDGRELYYLNGDEVMVVSVKTDPSFEMVGAPQTLFRATFIPPLTGEGTPWDIHPKTKKFLMIKPGESTDDESADNPRKIIIVTNWFEELKKLAPVD